MRVMTFSTLTVGVGLVHSRSGLGLIVAFAANIGYGVPKKELVTGAMRSVTNNTAFVVQKRGVKNIVGQTFDSLVAFCANANDQCL